MSETLDDYVAEDNPVCVIDAFVDTIGLAALGFDGTIENFHYPATST